MKLHENHIEEMKIMTRKCVSNIIDYYKESTLLKDEDRYDHTYKSLRYIIKGHSKLNLQKLGEDKGHSKWILPFTEKRTNGGFKVNLYTFYLWALCNNYGNFYKEMGFIRHYYNDKPYDDQTINDINKLTCITAKNMAKDYTKELLASSYPNITKIAPPQQNTIESSSSSFAKRYEEEECKTNEIDKEISR